MSDRRPASIPRPVWFLGFTSLFTDAATEMIYPLLPVYLMQVLGASAVSLGIIEGVAEAVNSGLKLASGWWADRRTHRRPIVIAGYAISSSARPLIALTRTWPQVLLVRALDRTGKGIRGAPRDAMLARFATRETRGRIFGFHRAMDHTGAIIGPLLATALLIVFPARYRLLFGLTAIPGALAVAMLFFVKEDGAGAAAGLDRQSPAAIPPRPDAATLSSSPHERLPGAFYGALGVILLFSLGNSADAFLLLRLGEALGSATYVPLLWAALHVVKASLSTWGGSLSDRVGRKPVIAAGWAVYALVYVGFAVSTTATAFVIWFLVYGIYFALAEGTERAFVTDLSPHGRRGTAFGLYNASQGAGLLAASVTFGYFYDRFGAPTAFGIGAALAGLAAVVLLFVPAEPGTHEAA
jgi:MFS family permease